MSKPIRSIYLLVLPQVHVLDLAAPAQIFGHDYWQERYQLHYISTSPNTTTHQGLQLAQLEPLPTTIPPHSWLFLIGTSKAARHLGEPYYLHAKRWLQTIAMQFELIAGICSGSVLAGYAGLLDGKRCTTHHALIQDLKQIAPKAKVVEDCIYVQEDNIWTSAGITTGIDLCLYLVAQYEGHQQATAIARDLVMFPRRAGEDSQIGFWLQYRNHTQFRIHQLQDQVLAKPQQAWRLTDLAASVHLGERQLRRLFKQATGVSVQTWLQQVRLAHSRQLLTTTQLPLEEIAYRCGFASERSLRRLWQQWEHSSPSAVRRAQP